MKGRLKGNVKASDGGVFVTQWKPFYYIMVIIIIAAVFILLAVQLSNYFNSKAPIEDHLSVDIYSARLQNVCYSYEEDDVHYSNVLDYTLLTPTRTRACLDSERMSSMVIEILPLKEDAFESVYIKVGDGRLEHDYSFVKYTLVRYEEQTYQAVMKVRV